MCAHDSSHLEQPGIRQRRIHCAIEQKPSAFRGTTYARPSSVRWLIVGNSFVKASQRLITRLLVLRDKIRRSFLIKHEVLLSNSLSLCAISSIWNAVLIFHSSDYARPINFLRIPNGTFHRNSRPGDWLGLASFLASSSRRFRKLAKLHCSSHFPLVLAAARHTQSRGRFPISAARERVERR